MRDQIAERATLLDETNRREYAALVKLAGSKR